MNKSPSTFDIFNILLCLVIGWEAVNYATGTNDHSVLPIAANVFVLLILSRLFNEWMKR